MHFPKKLKKGEIYVFNLLKGYEHHILKPGDEVKLISMLPGNIEHVEVETLDESYSGKVHVFCLILDRL